MNLVKCFLLIAIPLLAVLADHDECRPICRKCRRCHNDWRMLKKANDTGNDDTPIPDDWLLF